MARPVECVAWPDPALMDGELVGFLIAVHATWCDRTRLRSRSARHSARRSYCQPPRPSQKISMGVDPASRSVHSCNGPHRWRFPLEFPLAPPTPSRSGPLRGRGPGIVFTKTQTVRRLSLIPILNPVPNHRLDRKNWRRTSLFPRLDFPRSRPGSGCWSSRSNLISCANGLRRPSFSSRFSRLISAFLRTPASPNTILPNPC